MGDVLDDVDDVVDASDDVVFLDAVAAVLVDASDVGDVNDDASDDADADADDSRISPILTLERYTNHLHRLQVIIHNPETDENSVGHVIHDFDITSILQTP